MLSIFRWFLVSVTVVILTACGGGSSDGGDQQSVVSQEGNENSDSDSSGGGSSDNNPTGTNNETYTDNNGDIVPVLSEKPDVQDTDIGAGDEVDITIMRNINLNSGLAKSELSKYSAGTENIVFYYTNVAVNIDVKCEDYGFNQSNLNFSRTFENGIKYKTYSKKEYINDTKFYMYTCNESDFGSVPTYSDVAGKYTIIQSNNYYMSRY